MTDDWFQRAWHEREEVLYPRFFAGDGGSTIAPIPMGLFEDLSVREVDPRWLHCGVITFPPSPARDHFVYVTSGLSNAWDASEPDPSSESGLGFELRIDTSVREHWARHLLLLIAAQQLAIAAGATAGRLLGHGSRIAVPEGSFGEGSTEMRLLLVLECERLQIATGSFSMLQLFAITQSERDLAVAEGAEALVRRLESATAYPVSDPLRRSVV